MCRVAPGWQLAVGEWACPPPRARRCRREAGRHAPEHVARGEQAEEELPQALCHGADLYVKVLGRQ